MAEENDRVPAWMKGFADIGKPKPGGILDGLLKPKDAGSGASLERPQGAPGNPRYRPSPIVPAPRKTGDASDLTWEYADNLKQREQRDLDAQAARAVARNRANRAKGLEF